MIGAVRTHPQAEQAPAQDTLSCVRVLTRRSAGFGRERERRLVHCAGCGPPDVAFRERREHHPHREHEREYHQQGEHTHTRSMPMIPV